MTLRVAVIMLACRDYEATELALACHMRYLPENVPFFFLQNCRGNYDAERTLAAARRYAMLFPGRIRVVEDIPPGPAYHSVRALLLRPEMCEFDLICKTDDDAFPICGGWLDEMVSVFKRSEFESGEKLAYVTPLINNNTWGFPEVLRVMELEQEYFDTQARSHFAGNGPKRRIASPSEIVCGQDGTIWGYAYIARWLHEKTTLQPDKFIAATEGLACADVPAKDRYSIGCILFKRKLWMDIDQGASDDEYMMHMYCAENDLRIVCVRSVPFVHLAYFSQREEIRDITSDAKEIYRPRLNFPFPISLRITRRLEIEARLRWMEQNVQNNNFLDWEAIGRRQFVGVIKGILYKLGFGRRGAKGS